jgi:hypothetical protein
LRKNAERHKEGEQGGKTQREEFKKANRLKELDLQKEDNKAEKEN